MAAAKKKKILQYADKPMNRVGDRIYYGNLEDKYILALDIIESTAPGVPLNFTVYHQKTKTSGSVYASLLPDQGNSSYKIQFTDESTGNPFGGDIDDFFSDH